MRAGFTLIEVLFSMLIIAIISSISLEQISHIYRMNIEQSERASAQKELEYASNKIAIMMENSIKDSFVVLSSKNQAECKSLKEQSGFESNIISWIGVDSYKNYSYIKDGYYMPYWSGVVDLKNSSSTQIIDPIADFTRYQQTLKDLNEGESVVISFNEGVVDACDDYHKNGGSHMYEVEIGTQALIFKTKKPDKIFSRYYLSHTAYALSLENSVLKLYYGFAPWKNENSGNGKTTVLASNITSFGFMFDANALRFNICAKTHSTNEIICKEKSLF